MFYFTGSSQGRNTTWKSYSLAVCFLQLLGSFLHPLLLPCPKGILLGIVSGLFVCFSNARSLINYRRVKLWEPFRITHFGKKKKMNMLMTVSSSIGRTGAIVE